MEKNLNEPVCLKVILFLAFIVLFFPSFIIFIGVFILQDERINISNYILDIIILLVIIIVANVIIIFIPENNNYWYKYLLVSIATFVIITSIYSRASFLPKTIVRRYKIGNFDVSSIVLDKQGCNLTA